MVETRGDKIPFTKHFDSVFKIACLLNKSRYRVLEIAQKLKIKERTVYRNLKVLEELGWPVEQDFTGRYFIVEHSCPICGGNKKQPLEIYKNIDQTDQ